MVELSPNLSGCRILRLEFALVVSASQHRGKKLAMYGRGLHRWRVVEDRDGCLKLGVTSCQLRTRLLLRR